MKKKINNIYKKSLCILFIIIYLCSSIINVNAAILNIENVANEFSNTKLIQELANAEYVVNAKVDTVNKKLDIYGSEGKIFSFNYSDEYIEYDNRDMVITEDNCTGNIFDILWMQGVIDSVLKVSGYEGKTFKQDETYPNDYDTYGLQMDFEDYYFSGTDEDGGSWTKSGSVLKYFKISLDTTKIDALMTNYGVDIDTLDTDKKFLESLVPTIEAKDITENSATIYANVKHSNTDYDETIFCFIYRSDSKEGTYEQVSGGAINCTEAVGLVDEGLKSNTTYYYKAMVYGGKEYSDVLEVTTNSLASTSNNSGANANNSENKDDTNKSKKEGVNNPDTGSFISTISIIGAIGIIIAIGIAIKKKNRVYKI